MPEANTTPNPFLPAPAAPAAAPAARVQVPQLTGPSRPQPGVAPPEELLPVLPQARVADLWLLGVHGGSGESTLAELSPHWEAAGHAWPAAARTPATSWGPPPLIPVVLLARSSARGLRAAQFAAQQWASGQLDHVLLHGLVVIADAPGRLPKPLAQQLDIVAGGVPRLWTLPWVEDWRLGAKPSRARWPAAVKSVVNDLRVLSQPTWDGRPTSVRNLP